MPPLENPKMNVENSPFQRQIPPESDLDDWNLALYRHFFAAPSNVSAPPLVRLYVTAEDLSIATGRNNTPEQSRSAFIESLKQTFGSRSLALDASRRAKLWNPERPAVPPPFLSHLLFTCMIANDLAEELRWTGDFRNRLSHALGTGSQTLLERLPPLWKELAAWSLRQNLSGAGCKELRLPQVPDSGYHSIIGYSIRLAIPSRRDQSALAALLRQHELDGIEPDLNSVLPVVAANISRFSGDFEGVFREFVADLKTLPSSLLFQTAFWTAVRDVALAGQLKSSFQRSNFNARLELEDDDGRFWLALCSDKETQSPGISAIAVPSTRQSSFLFILQDSHGESLVDQAFSSTREPVSNELLGPIRAAIAGGILLFEETDDYVYVQTNTFPSSQQVRALVANRLNADFEAAMGASGLQTIITRSSFEGWSEWRGLTAPGLRNAKFSAFPSLLGVPALRATLRPPEIKILGGIRFGTGFVALLPALPHIQIADAENVSIELKAGEWVPLQALEGTADCWCLPPPLSIKQLLGSHRIVAFARSIPIAEQQLSFIENALVTAYKQPKDPFRWLIESTAIDAIPLSENLTRVSIFEVKRSQSEPENLNSGSPFVEKTIPLTESTTPLLELVTILCCRFSSQCGISEGDLLSIFTSTLSIKVWEVWPILRGWVEAGMLDALSDARWRARVYFARMPRFVLHRRGGFYEAILTGLIPPHLRMRLEGLAAAAGVTVVQRPSTSQAIPSLSVFQSNGVTPVRRISEELRLLPPIEVRLTPTSVPSVQSLIQQHASTIQNSWPTYRQWDWKRRTFTEDTSAHSMSGISLQWCRRVDGPDRYKLYKDNMLIWWTRSRTWAVLSAFTLAGVPIFDRRSESLIETWGDSLYLPLPVARLVSWIGPATPGPVKTEDGRTTYRYSFPDDRLLDLVIGMLWPGPVKARMSSKVSKGIISAVSAASGPLIPLPMALRRSMAEFEWDTPMPALVPVSALPRLYALFRANAGWEA